MCINEEEETQRDDRAQYSDNYHCSNMRKYLFFPQRILL